MARPLRVEFSGAYYHVINRGVERRVIFMDDGDARKFLDATGELGRRHQVALLAYCLMPNHYHLLLRTDGGSLKQFMRDLNGLYAQHVNRKLERVGPLFQGRYKAVLVGDDRYLLAIVRYIHRNPVEAGLVDRPEAYGWSSCATYYGAGRREVPLDRAMILGLFGESSAEAVARLRAFTDADAHAGDISPRAATGGVLLGSETFRRRMQRDHVPASADGRISRLRELRRPGPEIVQSLQARVLATGVAPSLRPRLLLHALHAGTSFTLAEIAGLTGSKSGPAVALALHRLNIRRSADPGLDRAMASLEITLRGAGTKTPRTKP